jgi:hypothetical protein
MDNTNKPCRAELIASGAVAIPKSCPRHGLYPCPAPAASAGSIGTDAFREVLGLYKQGHISEKNFVAHIDQHVAEAETSGYSAGYGQGFADAQSLAAPAPVSAVGAADKFGPTKDGCCGVTVTKRCEGCPHAAPLSAAEQAVEQWRLKGSTGPWYDVSADDKMATLGTHSGYEKRTLYRAAQPARQQEAEQAPVKGTLDANAVRAIRRAVRYLEENDCTGPAADLKALLLAPADGQELPALPIKTWQERYADQFPQGDVAFCPDGLRVKLLCEEVTDLRAALAAAMRQPQGDEQTMRSLIEDAVANHNSPEGYIKLCMTYFRHGTLAAKQGEKGGAA